MIDILAAPWPWYIAGPLIGLIVPALLILGGKQFGISENLRHLCAATIPGPVSFFKYDWKKGLWNMTFVLGIILGGFVAAILMANPDPVAISEATKADLAALGMTDFNGLVPATYFSWKGLLTLPGLVMIVGGGFLVGFGSRYAGGCTSGHAISGLADLQLPSLIAVIGFFVGGLISAHLLLPLIF